MTNEKHISNKYERIKVEQLLLNIGIFKLL